MMGDFIALPEPYRSWYLERVWAHISAKEAAGLEPYWRRFVDVPGSGWAFNFSMADPGWRKLPKIE